MKNIGIMGIQIGWTKNKEDNLNRALNLIDEGMSVYPKTDLICLPEIFYTIPNRENKSYIGESLDGPFASAFSACAKKYQVNIITGTFSYLKDGKIYNTCLAIDRKGKIVGEYSKTHLFDAFDRKESELFAAGNSLGLVDFDFGRVGIAVCYELRFVEYIRTVALQNIDLLCVPSAFYRPRHDQWSILTKSAALGNQIYVVAVNQFSPHCFGRSCIVDPNGIVTAGASDGEGVFYGSIDLDYQQEIREQNPLSLNRRPDLYQVK